MGVYTFSSHSFGFALSDDSTDGFVCKDKLLSRFSLPHESAEILVVHADDDVLLVLENDDRFNRAGFSFFFVIERLSVDMHRFDGVRLFVDRFISENNARSRERLISDGKQIISVVLGELRKLIRTHFQRFNGRFQRFGEKQVVIFFRVGDFL